jgi:two-component system, chemotaxis family, CheB/CheR fusion protein
MVGYAGPRSVRRVIPQLDCVYVAMPDDLLTLQNGAFRIPPVQGGQRRPAIDTIDAFFETLAAGCGPKAIAVVLSGTGLDGAGESNRPAAWSSYRIPCRHAR